MDLCERDAAGFVVDSGQPDLVRDVSALQYRNRPFVGGGRDGFFVVGGGAIAVDALPR